MTDFNNSPVRKSDPVITPPVGSPRPRQKPPSFPSGSVIKEILTRKPDRPGEDFLKNYKLL
ncbi:MAG: hypothetical protein QOJ87_281 [Verrucomicrobiota bacterium]|jgi:hypothetical protein